jgi:hypothetical protein
MCTYYNLCVVLLLIMMVHQDSGEAMSMYYFFRTYHGPLSYKNYYRSSPSNIISIHVTMKIFWFLGFIVENYRSLIFYTIIIFILVDHMCFFYCYTFFSSFVLQLLTYCSADTCVCVQKIIYET